MVISQNLWRWYALMALVTLIWASVFHVIKFIIVDHLVMVTAFYRYGVSAIFLYLVISFSRHWPQNFGLKHILRYTILGLIGITFYNIFFFQGIALTSPVNGALVMALNPVTTALLNHFFGKEKFRWLQWAGIFLSFAGILIVVSEGRLETLFALTLQKGNLIIFGAPLSWAIYSILSKRFMQDENPSSLATGAMIIGAIFLLPLMFFMPGGFLPNSASMFGSSLQELESFFRGDGLSLKFFPHDFTFWAVILYTGIFASGLSYLWWSKGIQKLGVNQSAVIINLIPVFTIVIDFFVDNAIAPIKYLGAAVVIGGVLIVTMGHRIRLPWQRRGQRQAGRL